MTTLNEIEAVARAMYEARNKHLQNCYSWDDSELDNEHPDCRPSLYRDAKAAIAAIAALDESRAREDSEPIARIAEVLTNRLPFVKDGNMADLARVVYALAVPDESRARDKGSEQRIRNLESALETARAYMQFELDELPAHHPTLPSALAMVKSTLGDDYMTRRLSHPAPGQSEAIRAEVIAQGVDPSSDKATP